ncbi:hypothetical protein OFC37_31735, partial [Escherichia coli]|nr:hypothetical protein [Escherichia coli]
EGADLPAQARKEGTTAKMYGFSRAIYRELADEVLDDGVVPVRERQVELLRACERTIERMAFDRHYFAKPARTLFRDVRTHFPVCAQH